MNYEPENDFENTLILTGLAVLIIILSILELYLLTK